MEKRVENWNLVHSYKLNTRFLKTNYCCPMKLFKLK